MVSRDYYTARVREALRRAPVTAILGPRQCGKTTLARAVADARPGTTYLDLEAPADLALLANPSLYLGAQRGLVVIDEVQVRGDLFPLLRVLADRPGVPARFLILGSASPQLVRHASESLAGRVEIIEMAPFDLGEAGPGEADRLWLRGGFPRAFLADSEADVRAWHESFTATFLQRDIPQLGITLAATTLRRFWSMLAHYHGQTLNTAELARAFGVSAKTARHYIDVLEATYMVRQLAPWFENLAKRQVKAPKLYLRDTGLLHYLLGIGDATALWRHPKVGASWEGFALEQALRLLRPDEAYFWGTHNGAELDLLAVLAGRRVGFEFKWTEAPSTSRSMHVALADLALSHLWVVYPGTRRVPLHEAITALPLTDLTAGREALLAGRT